MNVEKLFAQYQASADENARQTLVGVMEPHTEDVCAYIARSYRDLSPRAVSYCLSQLSRKDKWNGVLCAMVEGNPDLVDHLYRADPKTRKNLYIWLGSCPTLLGAALLDKAAREEGTFFAIPSLLLAIGKSGGRVESARALFERLDPLAVPPKIWAEIEDAFHKALDRLSDKASPVSVRFDRPHAMLLTTAPHLHGVLRDEIGQLLPVVGEVDEGLVVSTQDPEGLYDFRCFYEAWLYEPTLYGVAWSDLPERLAQVLSALDLPAMHGVKEVRYRVSVKGVRDKRPYLAAVTAALKGQPLVNSPSNYQVELIVSIEDKVKCFVKLWGLTDDRYAYRKEALPASINPTTAAIIARLSRRYVKDPQVVLDGFCGTSTMLVEASKVYPKARLVGVDIVKEAVDKSAVNLGIAGVRAQLIQSDILKYKPKSPASLLISNMPYGNRVGTHESNTRLYRALIERLPSLVGGGFALLLTTEIALLKGLVGSDKVKLVRMYTLPAGGLEPALFVLKVSKD